MSEEVLGINSIDISDKNYNDLAIFLKSLDVDIFALKKSHFLRRIKTRMVRVGTKTVDEYIKFTRKNIQEQENLKQSFSINVTHFFRNPDSFEELQKRIIPLITNNNARAKIWSAGCADGAEPYTLAMILDNLGISPAQVKIIASDYNPDSLALAKRGIYPKDYDKEMPSIYKNKYLTLLESGEYQVDPKLKNYIEFKIHNLISDDLHPIIGKNTYNLVLCRNVMIYFATEHQNLIYQKFYDALKINGFYMTGRSEVVLGEFRSKLTVFNALHRISQKIE